MHRFNPFCLFNMSAALRKYLSSPDPGPIRPDCLTVRSTSASTSQAVTQSLTQFFNQSVWGSVRQSLPQSLSHSPSYSVPSSSRLTVACIFVSCIYLHNCSPHLYNSIWQPLRALFHFSTFLLFQLCVLSPAPVSITLLTSPSTPQMYL